MPPRRVCLCGHGSLYHLGDVGACVLCGCHVYNPDRFPSLEVLGRIRAFLFGRWGVAFGPIRPYSGEKE
jgi:hypothetical protein